MKYYFKVWLFTILVSPVLVVIGLVYPESVSVADFFYTLIMIWTFSVLLGSALALPALFLFRLLNKDLAGNDLPVVLKKAVHAIVGVLLIWATFFLMNRSIFNESSWYNMLWIMAYSITLVTGAFLYKMQDPEV